MPKFAMPILIFRHNNSKIRVSVDLLELPVRTIIQTILKTNLKVLPIVKYRHHTGFVQALTEYDWELCAPLPIQDLYLT